SQEYNPYRVEEIVLKRRSGGVRTSAADSAAGAVGAAGAGVVAAPGVDLSRPHRQELCCRCRGRRLSCDHTFSFKYLV
uniref:Zygote arrest protein 1-like n=1 Tax=Petromyzon marinus TaxID=7757 RepID=A0AAJ7T9G7_PETMA